MNLIPSKETKRLISKNKPLSKEEELYWVDEYNNGKREKAQLILLNGITKVFANEISKNNRHFLKTIPSATYDDIFNKMVYMFLKKLPEFDPNISKLNTWATWQITPLIKNPAGTMGSKFESNNKFSSIDKKYGSGDDNSDMTLGDMLPDGSIDIESDYNKTKERQKILNALKKLKKDDREIIMALMGFSNPPDDWKSSTGKVNIANIAKAKGVNHMNIHGKVKRIYDELRAELRQSKLKKYKKYRR